MIVGSQQVIPSIMNPVNHVISYDAHLWDWSYKVKYNITIHLIHKWRTRVWAPSWVHQNEAKEASYEKMASKLNIHCCVPLCTQRGPVGPKGEQIGFFKFPHEEEMKKRWIHAIRRDVGRFFHISGASKVSSLHISSLVTYQRVLVDECIWRQVQFRRYLLGNKLRHKSGRPPLKGLINNSEKTGIQSQKRVFFRVFGARNITRQNIWSCKRYPWNRY